ncbi:hypothetical protein [Anaerotruncus rubiinfantis]|uniref:hypothetical protein n=1 Tax=Anaerotruncus rubiinfantis TaxID=1720200 RepID=UPI00189B5493|nr:hypothetical protein [Anaerotruncus rubiinfantis]
MKIWKPVTTEKINQNGSAVPSVKDTSGKANTELLAEMCRREQAYILRGRTIPSEIIKGIKDGKPLDELLLKAVACIALMTGDNAIYPVCERELKERKVPPF